MTDDLLERLRSLPPDLPDPVDRFDRVRSRVLGRRRRLVVAAAVVAVVAVVVPVWAGLSGTGPPATGPLTCPAVHTGAPPWVPALPRGVDGRSRLVPPQPPTSALVCAYDGDNGDDQAGWLLSGHRELAGGLDQLAADLTLVARKTGGGAACVGTGGPQTDYLLGLTYPNGTLWISAVVNNCMDTSNGRFTALRGVGPQIAAAYEAGFWPAPAPPADNIPCAAPATGRAGQESAMVPDGAVAVKVCEGGGDPADMRRTTSTDVAGLVDALNALPTQKTINMCHPAPGPPGTYYNLLFSYITGPDVLVRVTVGCDPAITNGSLDAADASSVLPYVTALLGG